MDWLVCHRSQLFSFLHNVSGKSSRWLCIIKGWLGLLRATHYWWSVVNYSPVFCLRLLFGGTYGAAKCLSPSFQNNQCMLTVKCLCVCLFVYGFESVSSIFSFLRPCNSILGLIVWWNEWMCIVKDLFVPFNLLLSSLLLSIHIEVHMVW